jgi:hypothetical protein
MARADADHTTNLSSLIRDPFVRAAFEAAERDGQGSFWNLSVSPLHGSPNRHPPSSANNRPCVLPMEQMRFSACTP